MPLTYRTLASVSVANGDTTVTVDEDLTGIAFAGDYLALRGMREGVRIAADVTGTTFELEVAWPYTSLTADPADLQYERDAVRSSERTRQYLDLIGEIAATGIQPDAFGVGADRDAYDDEAKGYIFLDLGDPWTLYAKLSGDAADWDDGQQIEGPIGPSGLIGIWRGAWLTVTAYAANDAVFQGGSSYIALTAHTSGTFATDLGAGKWQLVASKGDTGATGAMGVSDGLSMTFSTTTTASNPGAGTFRLNNATHASATAAYIDNVEALAGTSVTAILDSWDDSTATIRGTLKIVSKTDETIFRLYNVTGWVVDSTGYRTVTLAYVAGAGTLANGTACSLIFSRTGDNGAAGSNGTNGTNGVDGKFSGTEVIKTAAYTALAADSGKTIILNKATTDTLSFDAAATLGSTWMIMVKNIGAGAWTLDPNGSEQIDGATTVSLAQGESVVVSSNGTALRTLFRGSAAFTQFTAASSSAPAKLDLAEQTTNGTNKVTVQVPSALSADYTFTLPPATVTFDSFIVALLNSTTAAGAQSAIGVREKLTASRTYYVRTDGSDSNNGLANTSGGAFLTIQKAWNTILTLDLGGFTATIQLGDGTYAAGLSITTAPVGGPVVINGNSGTPTNVVVSASIPIAIDAPGVNLTVQNFRATSTYAGIYNGAQGSIVTIGAGMSFAGTPTYAHIAVLSGKVKATSGFTIASGGASWLTTQIGGVFESASLTFTFSGTPAWSGAGIIFDTNSSISLFSITMSGSATGKRYQGTTSASINSFGAGTASTYFPGNSNGTTATGAQQA